MRPSRAASLVLSAALAVTGILGPGAAAAPAAVASSVGTSTPVRGWARPGASLRENPASVLDAVPHGARVRVAALSVRNGHPQVTVVPATGRAAALAEIARAQARQGTLSVAIDVPVHADAASAGDPSRAGQWALDRLGAEATWAVGRGAGVTVAVVDTGVERSHPDLAGRLLSGVDLVAGGDGGVDPAGHGTHVAGIVAAVAGNGIGVAGLAPEVSLLPVRVLDETGSGWSSTIASGVIWAVDHGAQVVNLSLGASSSSSVLQQAIDYARAHGALVVAAAGNGRSSGNQPNYPAAYDSVVAVAATDQTDASASFSTTGSYVDIAAPGVRILSTYPGGGYATMSGTSMATPYVAAAAALVKSAAPGLEPAAVAQALEASATDLAPAGRDDATGSGLVDPRAAICRATACAAAPQPTPTVAAAPAPTVLTGQPGPRALRFGATVRGAARLVDAATGVPIAAVPLRVCRSAAPARVAVCSDVTTDGSGTARYGFPATANVAVAVSFVGSATAAPATAPPVSYSVSGTARLVARHARVVATVRPAAEQRVTLQRRTGARWVAVGRRAVDRHGIVEFRRLPGAVYRVTVATNPVARGLTTRTVRVR